MDRAQLRLCRPGGMIALQHVEQSETQCAFESVELLPAQGFDLLSHVLAIDFFPPTFAYERGLLHQPGVEIAIVFRRGRRVGGQHIQIVSRRADIQGSP